MEWRRLTQPEEPASGRAMALYEASFPRHEQRLPDEQRAVLSHPEYHFTQLFDGAEFVGLLLYRLRCGRRSVRLGAAGSSGCAAAATAASGSAGQGGE